jgi:hypothetical protein
MTAALGGVGASRRLGAPGIRVAPPEPVRLITGVRRDVAAFVGIAPRGPARMPIAPLEPDTDVAVWLAGPRARSVAVAVTSWDEYRLRFGGFEGPGRLPYAVAAFFAQGGERAWVVRLVADHGDPVIDDQGRARGQLGGLAATDGAPVVLAARSEGSWGNALRATLTFVTRPVPVVSSTESELVVAAGEWVPAGSLVRVRLPGDVLELRYVDRSELRPDPADAGSRRHLTLDNPVASAPSVFEVVAGTLSIVDPDPSFPRAETLDGIGLRSDHPRWLARVVAEESELVWPEVDWAGGTVNMVDPLLAPVVLVGVLVGEADTADVTGDGGVPHMTGGVDRWQHVVPEHFWDPGWVPGDEGPGAGVHCLAENDEIGLLVVPDLYEPLPLAPVVDVRDPPSLAGPSFEQCVAVASVEPRSAARPPGLDGLALDPSVPDDLEQIVVNQQALVTFADQRRDLTLLLDVPLGLTQRRILQWRSAFDSPYAAAYHPWLDVATPDDARDALIRINPSAFAAGIIAAREQRLGVAYGPFNELAVGAVRVSAVVAPEAHDELHPVGVNVFLPERDGIRLTGARTLARSSELRQLSVARLMAVLRLSLERELDWAVFEPNGEALWGEVRRMVHAFLTRLYEVGAFVGATTKEAFFVRCDPSTMTRNDLDQGRFICLVGVAPAEPLEYLVLEIARDRDTSVRVEAAGTR